LPIDIFDDRDVKKCPAPSAFGLERFHSAQLRPLDHGLSKSRTSRVINEFVQEVDRRRLAFRDDDRLLTAKKLSGSRRSRGNLVAISDKRCRFVA